MNLLLGILVTLSVSVAHADEVPFQELPKEHRGLVEPSSPVYEGVSYFKREPFASFNAAGQEFPRGYGFEENSVTPFRSPATYYNDYSPFRSKYSYVASPYSQVQYFRSMYNPYFHKEFPYYVRSGYKSSPYSRVPSSYYNYDYTRSPYFQSQGSYYNPYSSFSKYFVASPYSRYFGVSPYSKSFGAFPYSKYFDASFNPRYFESFPYSRYFGVSPYSGYLAASPNSKYFAFPHFSTSYNRNPYSSFQPYKGSYFQQALYSLPTQNLFEYSAFLNQQNTPKETTPEAVSKPLFNENEIFKPMDDMNSQKDDNMVYDKEEEQTSKEKASEKIVGGKQYKSKTKNVYNSDSKFEQFNPQNSGYYNALLNYNVYRQKTPEGLYIPPIYSGMRYHPGAPSYEHPEDVSQRRFLPPHEELQPRVDDSEFKNNYYPTYPKPEKYYVKKF
ncbi:unnamed protein product [Cyprideis torosa]|uniref:Uncharacterized protein n=1 Tax=Cyprideis torosa TaxID=163714 RepID=A0A7R8WGH6_9CRUS|nr:unnamed protein product [Cyprideis torosa]CAG0892133.1 unnamed protein product [Cyprideis torosa]